MPSRHGIGKGLPQAGLRAEWTWSQLGLTSCLTFFFTQTMVLHSEQPAGLPEETQGVLGTGSPVARLLPI